MGFKARKPTWKQTAIKALTESVVHWEQMRDDKPGSGDPWWENCACCVAFLKQNSGRECAECPIKLRTGVPQCRATPWAQAKNAWGDKGRFPTRAQEEIDFLLGTERLVRQGRIRPEDPNGSEAA